MWNNIGRKLKKLAKIICWIGIVFAVIAGSRIISERHVFAGLIRMALGGALAWIASWATYGLGIVVDYVENKKPQSASVYDNSWVCPECRAINPDSRADCRNCGARKL